MTAGRPSKGRQEAYPELSELAAWFAEALHTAGYENIHQFLQRHAFEKNAAYGVMNGTRFITLESMRALCVSLGRDVAEVESIWFRAKHSMERGSKRPAERGRKLGSWADMPSPHLWVRDLLLAQAREAELLPYRLLGVEGPPLPAIYVRQLLRGKNRDLHEGGDEPGNPGQEDASETVLPAGDAISRHDALLITGVPGAGKSTLVREFVRSLARIWLREDSAAEPPVSQPVVPLRLPARAFSESGSFSSVIAGVVRDVYGLAMVSEPDAMQFADLVHGARWLLFIDGIDEVADRDLRKKIIRAIAGHARSDGPYRFVVTTRPLLAAELAPLRHGGFASYSIEPFGQPELRIFATRWFAAQNPATCDERAGLFVREILDGRLKEAALNPLLATIAAVAKTRDPDRPLPANRVGLYEQFCDYLINDDANMRSVLEEIRRGADEPQVRMAEWAYAHRSELVAHLAEQHRAGQSMLVGEARAWIAEHQRAKVSEADLSDDILRELLTRTGLLVIDGSGLRFLHQAIAEYLAARAVADRLPPDLPDLKIWTDLSLEPAERTFVVFTLLLWGQRGHDLGAVLRRLLDGPPRHLLLAGRILGDCGNDRPAHAVTIVDRLMDLALGASAVTKRDDFEEGLTFARHSQQTDPASAAPSEVFWILGRMCGDPYAAIRLRDVATRRELTPGIRAFAAVAFGRVAGNDDAQAILEHIAADSTDTADLVLIAEGMLALDVDAVDAAKSVLRKVDEDLDDLDASLRAVDLLAQVGESRRSVTLAWSVLNAPGVYPTQIRAVVRTILADGGTEVTAKLLRVANRLIDTASPVVRWVLVELIEFGAQNSVIHFCQEALADPRTHSWQVPRLAAGWVMGAGPTAVDEVSRILRDRGAFDDDAFFEIALRLLETGHRAEAFEIAIELLRSSQQRSDYDWEAAWICLSVSQPGTLQDVLLLIDSLPQSDGWGSLRTLEKLTQLGETDRAVSQAKSIIENSHRMDTDAASTALRVLQSAGDPRALAEDFARRAESTDRPSQKAHLIQVVAELGNLEHAAEMARQVFAGSAIISGDDLGRMVRIQILSEGVRAAPDILVLSKQRLERNSSWHGKKDLPIVADCLARLGALSTATQIWLELTTDLSTPFIMSSQACSSLVHSGNRAGAIDALRDALGATGLSAAERARLGSLLSWAVLRMPGADFEEVRANRE
jgi:hypothetical protein